MLLVKIRGEAATLSFFSDGQYANGMVKLPSMSFFESLPLIRYLFRRLLEYPVGVLRSLAVQSFRFSLKYFLCRTFSQ